MDEVRGAESKDATRNGRTLTRREFARRVIEFGAGAAFAGGMLAVLDGCGGAPGMAMFATPALSQQNLQPLNAVAKTRNFVFGTATGQQLLASDADFAAQVANHCGILTPENELKWNTVEPQPGVFNFAPGDWLADFASRNNMLFRGHNLVWHNQIPLWAGQGTATQVQQQLVSHITAEVTHYAGRVHSWDVVNEAVEPADGRSDGLRSTVWLNALGPTYIDLAFRTAAAADPKALLVYNDYGLEGTGSSHDQKRSATLQLLKRLKANGVPIHALGLQAHLDSSGISTSKLSSFMQQVADLGLKIFVTELDVTDQSMPADVETRDEEVAGMYHEFLETVLQQSAVCSVQTWGLSDRYTWLSSFSPRSDGNAVRPLPLDSALQPKAALWAMLDAFRSAPQISR